MENISLGADDYATTRVPRSSRRPWFGIAVQRFGSMSDLTQFLLGAILGFGMTFWGAFWALTVGSIIFEAMTILIGIIGAREGLNTSMLTRWTGFGRGGSSILGFTICLSLFGWFGIQSGIAGAAMGEVFPFVPTWIWTTILGLSVTLIALRGFGSMQRLANFTVPAFLLIIGWTTISGLSGHSIIDLMASPAPGPRLDFLTAVTLVAGGYVVGSLIAADMNRFNRSTADVVKQAVVGLSAGNYLIGLAAVLLAHALQTDNIASIVFGGVGWVGAFAVIIGSAKINVWNIYSSSLGAVSFADNLLKVRINRGVTTLVIGLIGTALGALGFLDHFTSFLVFLGVFYPPVIRIMLAEYYVEKTWRPQLDETRDSGEMPNKSPNWVPASLIIWVLAAGIGYLLPWGLSVLNSAISGAILYIICGKIGWLRSFGDEIAPENFETNTRTQRVKE